MWQDRRREKGRDEKKYHLEQKVPSKSLSAKNCLVCFCLFNENAKRPRTIPCGHTFCSECITSTIRGSIFTCPSCRKIYEASSANTFPISYITLALISEMVTGNSEDNGEVSKDALKSSKPTSKRLKSQISETLTEVESVSRESSSLRSQLQLYASQLDEWKSEHQQFTSQLDDIIQKINREKTRIETSLREEALAKAELARTADPLKAQNRTLNIFEALENVHIKYEQLEEWINTTNESFPNMELIIGSQKLRKQCKIGPVNPSPFQIENQKPEGCVGGSLSLQDVTPVLPGKGLHYIGASSDERCPSSSITIQEKIKSALQDASHPFSLKAVQTDYDNLFSKEDDIVVKNRFLGQLKQNRQVFALHDEKENGKKRYARLSLDEKEHMFLHALSEEPIHLQNYSIVIKYEEILRYVPCTPRRTFLDFGVDGKYIGRVVISLIDEGNYTENFHILCLGRERGLSYRHSNILEVGYKGKEREYISLGDYERRSYYGGGRAVVRGVDWENERKRYIYKSHTGAGFVWGRIDYSGARVSQFLISMRNQNQTYDIPCFGKVVEGLDVIRGIIDRHHRMIEKVKIIDCGVVLST